MGQNSILMKFNNVLLSGKVLCALGLSALMMTSCSKNHDFGTPPVEEAVPADQSVVLDSAESTISATAVTPGYKAFRFTEIPFSSADLVNPGRGAEQWHGHTDVNVPTEICGKNLWEEHADKCIYSAFKLVLWQLLVSDKLFEQLGKIAFITHLHSIRNIGSNFGKKWLRLRHDTH